MSSLASSLVPEKSECSEVKVHGKPEVRRPDHRFLLKRKWRSVEGEVEEGGEERSDDHKRAKSGELCAHTHTHTHTHTWM